MTPEDCICEWEHMSGEERVRLFMSYNKRCPINCAGVTKKQVTKYADWLNDIREELMFRKVDMSGFYMRLQKMEREMREKGGE